MSFGNSAPAARFEFDPTLRVEFDKRRAQGIDPTFAEEMLNEIWDMFLTMRVKSGPREQVYTAQTVTRSGPTQVDIIVRRRRP